MTGVAGLTAPVERVMAHPVVMIFEEIPMTEVWTIAARYDYNGFPVVTRDGRLVGMITKGDLLRAVRASLINPGVWQDPASRWMAHGLVALRPTDSLETAVALLVEFGLRSVPVIDDESRVIGIVSRNDLINAVDERTVT
jgi:CBS domain-containing protein